MQSPVSPGWYPDPADPNTLRYWDGSSWRESAVVTRPRSDVSPGGAGVPVANAHLADAKKTLGQIKGWIVAATIVTILIATAVLLQKAKTNTLIGSIVVTDVSLYSSVKTLDGGPFPKAGEGCVLTGGYSDIKTGAPVIVRDSGEKIVGKGFLLGGKAYIGLVDCGFAFIINDIPTDEYYSVEVANRGKVVFSIEDLEASGWVADLSLGNKE